MSLVKIVEQLRAKFVEEILFTPQADLSNYTTLKLKSYAPLITVKNVEVLKKLVATLTESDIKYFIIGKGANSICITQDSYPLICLDFSFDKATLDNYQSSYILPSSLPLSLLTSAAIRLGLGGFEVLTGIPATIGGAIVMNAGTKHGSISQIVKRVWVIDKYGEERIEVISNSSFSYRKNNFLTNGDIVTRVELKPKDQNIQIASKIKQYLQVRKDSQPLEWNTCGCTFKNNIGEQTCSAGKFIDIMGLAGFTYRGLRVSHKHANFIEHIGEATDSDFIWFTKFIQHQLFINFGIHFEFEYCCIGM